MDKNTGKFRRVAVATACVLLIGLGTALFSHASQGALGGSRGPCLAPEPDGFASLDDRGSLSDGGNAPCDGNPENCLKAFPGF